MIAVNRNDLEIVRHIRASYDEELDDGERIALERLALVAQKSGAADQATLDKANRIAQRFGLKSFGAPRPAANGDRPRGSAAAARPETAPPKARDSEPSPVPIEVAQASAPTAVSPSAGAPSAGAPHARRGFQLTVFSKSGCPYCDKAKAHLAEQGIPFHEERLDDEAERLAFYEASSERWGRAISSMPQVVIEVGGLETLIGGHRELSQSGLERTIWSL